MCKAIKVNCSCVCGKQEFLNPSCSNVLLSDPPLFALQASQILTRVGEVVVQMFFLAPECPGCGMDLAVSWPHS